MSAAGGNFLKLFFSLNVLLLFIPLSLYLEYLRPQAHTLIFFSACLGIIPLAGWMGKATEQIADRAGEGIGGLLNATFGNAAELIIAIVALRAGYISGTDMGGGLRLGVGVDIRLIEFDYALSGYGKFGSVHRFSLSYKFGKPVEVTPHSSPEQEQARWKVERARGFMRENRYYEAILELNGALEIDPGSIEALDLMKKARNLVDTER